jgi:hypothetical protein
MQVGSAIPVSFQLFDCATDQFVRAWVREPDGTLVGGTSINLTQVALGLYQDFTLSMPDVPFITVQYVVYSDSGYTVVSPSEGAGADTFFRDPQAATANPFMCFLAGVIDGEVPCAPNGIQDVIIMAGRRTLALQILLGDSGLPLDLADVEVVTCRFMNSDRTVLEVSSDDTSGPIVITNAGGGLFTCELTALQTADLMEQTPAPFTVVLSFPDGDVACNFPYQLSVVAQSV